MTATPPDAVTEGLARRSAALDKGIPVRSGSNLLVPARNIVAFGSLTAKWAAGQADFPKRGWAAVACNPRWFPASTSSPCRKCAAAPRPCGSCWTGPPGLAVIASDVIEGSAGHAERLAFRYNADRVQPSGLVGEIVLPPI